MSQVLAEQKGAQTHPRLLIEALLQVTDAVLALNGEHRIILWNEAAERLLGWPSPEAIGRTLEEVAPCLLSFGELLEDKDEGSGEATIVREGELIELEVNARLVRGEEATRPVMLVCARDVTEERRAGALLKERQRELVQAQKMTAVGELAAGVAHDLNNLLTAITGYGELALASDSEDAWREDVQSMILSAQRAAAIARRILDFSRPRARVRKIVSVNEVLTDLGGFLSRSLGKSVGMDLCLEAPGGFTRIDRNELEQVVLNLVINARDAMPAGGSVTVRSAEVELSGSFCRTHPGTSPGAYVKVSVSDTGCGMDADTQLRVFEPFFTTKDASGGTGLGLAIVSRIVKESGGSIWVTSEPGRGATFDVYLPRAEVPKASAQDAVEATANQVATSDVNAGGIREDAA